MPQLIQACQLLPTVLLQQLIAQCCQDMGLEVPGDQCSEAWGDGQEEMQTFEGCLLVRKKGFELLNCGYPWGVMQTRIFSYGADIKLKANPVFK